MNFRVQIDKISLASSPEAREPARPARTRCLSELKVHDQALDTKPTGLGVLGFTSKYHEAPSRKGWYIQGPKPIFSKP